MDMSPSAPSEDLVSDSHPEFAEDAYILKPYGVGIDTHSRFIQVCVLVRTPDGVKRCDREFTTEWSELKRGRDWAEWIVRRFGGPEALDLLEHDFAYTIESTGTYHLPVLKAWGGSASVVNPLLANPARRKTDVLDARLLAYHAITGMWPASYTPPPPIQLLRIFLNMREDAARAATRSSNRINNFLLRFGHTFGSQCRVTDSTGRAITEDLLDDRHPEYGGVCPEGIPVEARDVFRHLYAQYDWAMAMRSDYEKQAQKWADRCEFPLGTKESPFWVTGKELRKLLLSVPGFGPLSALYWMAEVVTPTRFPNAKALGAFCGCDPSLKVSAGKVTQHTRRAGNMKLHLALTRAAQPLLVHASEPLGKWGRSLWKRHKTGGFKKACAAVARRMAEASFHVTRTGEPFDYSLYSYFDAPEYPDAPLTAALCGKYSKVLQAFGTIRELGLARDDGRLTSTKGVGEKCLELVNHLLAEALRPNRPQSRNLPARQTSVGS